LIEHHEIDVTPDELDSNNNEIDVPPDEFDGNNNEIESVPSSSYSYPDQDTDDIENDESYYSEQNIKQPTSKSMLPVCQNCADTNESTKRSGQKSSKK
ncbi:18754_t:CDS:2, partial [Dentiscutata erythropus]